MIAVLDSVGLLRAIEKETLRRAAESSLYEFVKQAWHVVEPGVSFVESWHIKTICEHLEAVTYGDITRLLINIPPRHSKSTIVSVMWPMWEWLAYPQHQYLCASYSGTLSTRDSVKARRLIQSPWYQERWGDLYHLADDQNAKQRFENNKMGYRIATSVDGGATGEGGSRLILDDPHSAKEAQSDPIREGTLDWFRETWMTRMNTPKIDATIVVMQRLHEQDVSGYILETLKDWEHVCIPAEYDGKRRKSILGFYDPRKKKGELICPERFGEEEINKLKLVLGEYGTAGQLQQDPSPADGGILKTGCFKLWPYSEGLPPFEFIVQSYDCAFTEKTSGDPTAATAWAVFTHKRKRQVMLIDAWSEHLGYPALRAKAIEDWQTEYGGPTKTAPWVRPKRADVALVEAKASGQSLIQDFRLANIPVMGYNPGKADKVSRAHQAAPVLERGIIWIPESVKTPGHPVSWAKAFLKQVEKFPVAEHDDYVDTFTQLVIYLKDQGWLELPVAKDEEAPPQNQKRINPYAA